MLLTTFGIWDFASNVELPSDGRFHHVAVSLDADFKVRFYLDGVRRQIETGPKRMPSPPSELNIGRNHGFYDEHWQGAIDEVAVYDYVLTDDQLRSHFDAATLAVYRAGDTDFDGDVDLEDLNNVRNNFGESGVRVVGDTSPLDGDVDLDDLNAVRNNFGGEIIEASPASVPEPSAFVVAILSIGFGIVVRLRDK